MLLPRPDGDGEHSPLTSFHSVNGIRNNMEEYLNELIGVTLDHSCSALFLNLHSNAVSPPRARQVHSALQKRADIHGSTMQGHLLSEAEHVLHQTVRTASGIADPGGHPLSVFIRRGLGAQILDILAHRGHGSIDLMRHSRHELA